MNTAMDCVILASGSSGNCIYIGNDTDGVVIDAGIGYMKQLMVSQNIPVDNIRSLLLTHEHSDHIRTAKTFLKTMKIPVTGSGGTLDTAKQYGQIPEYTQKIMMRESQAVMFGSISVTSFRTHHDAAEPTGFIVDDGDTRIGVCTDTAEVSAGMEKQLASCTAVILESNYSEHAIKTDTFEPCGLCRACGAECRGDCRVFQQYPVFLKNRIINDGHLSNEASSAVLSVLKNSADTIALAHLSKNYNRPNVARTAAEQALRESGVRLFVSDQMPGYRESRMVRFSV